MAKGPGDVANAHRHRHTASDVPQAYVGRSVGVRVGSAVLDMMEVNPLRGRHPRGAAYPYVAPAWHGTRRDTAPKAVKGKRQHRRDVRTLICDGSSQL